MEELKKELEKLLKEIESKTEESMGISGETPEYNEGAVDMLQYVIGRVTVKINKKS